MNYVLDNPNVDIDSLTADNVDPILYFYPKAGVGGEYIAFNGATSSTGFDTSYGNTFSTSISLSTFGTASGYLDKPQLIYLLIDNIVDNRDGNMQMLPSNLIISGTAGQISTILSTGTYSLTFNFSDIAHNYLDSVFVDLNIIV